MAYQIRSVLQNLLGIDVDRLPKILLVKLMALEADILAKKQVVGGKNCTLHMDVTTTTTKRETFLECTSYYCRADRGNRR